MKLQSIFLPVAVLLIGITFTPIAALAQSDRRIEQAVEDANQQNTHTDQVATNIITKGIDQQSETIKKGILEWLRIEMSQKTDTLDHIELEPAISAFPTASALTDDVLKAIMDTRYRELNRIPITGQYSPAAVAGNTTATNTGADSQYPVDYLIDSSLTKPDVDIQSFDVFMRYFCDPNARGYKTGTSMKDYTIPRGNVPYHGGTIKYNLGCGEVTGADLGTRHKLLGTDDKSAEATQMIGLPMRPADLFFNPTTFPTLPSKTGTGVAGSTTNRMADIYFGAFAQSLQFLIGSAPPAGNSLQNQAVIAHQMLASYPFAILFAERAGTMGAPAAKALGKMLAGKLGQGLNDAGVVARLQNIKTRNTVSIAEYMDILMYQMPTSPGYYTYISTVNNPEVLKREEVWLTALQTALNYQRNRWLEILAALEATK